VKAFFASLLCLLLAASQSFAIKGGPPYPASSNLVGSYAGVLQGVFDPTNPGSSNSIGVFSIGVPKTGNATGPFVMFSRGRVFSGTIQGTADPTKASVKGLLDARFNYNLLVPVTDTVTDATGKTTFITHIETVPVSAHANGPLDATVASTKSARTLSASTTILQGSAVLNISEGQVAANGDPVVVSILSLSVSGYKQSDTPPTGTGG
jgi:hypothetical protein